MKLNSLAARRLRLEEANAAAVAREPQSIILSVKLDNGAFESSVTIPITEAIDFDKHAARWLALAHTALQHGVTEMAATLSKPAPHPEAEPRG